MGRSNIHKFFYICISCLIISTGCQLSLEQNNLLSIEIIVDNTRFNYSIPSGISVAEALSLADLSLGESDKISPSKNSILEKNTTITIIRVKESIEVQQEVVPYERRELPNESMTIGEIRLLQAGKNGILERTILHIIHDGIEISKTIVSEILLEAPESEVVMVGVPNPYAKFSLPGKLAYLNSGNAWIIESSTASRRALVTTGDLDGRIFSLSPDGQWLLFSRQSSKPADEEINTLWLVNVAGPGEDLIDIHVTNVVHFAEWQPGSEYKIAFSSVEPRATAPGWQANNDLYLLPFDSDTGTLGSLDQIIPNSSGGIYGWWGTTFEWSPDGSQLAYARPDSLGLVDFENGSYVRLLQLTPLKTFSDWAWVPGLTWSSDMQTLFYIAHAPPPGVVDPEESPIFDLMAFSLATARTSTLKTQVGMFAYPMSSPSQKHDGELIYQIACLQSIFVTQSETSRYRQMLMDHDGSDQVILFPDGELTGIQPQSNWGEWSPDPQSPLLAVLYGGNLWIIDTVSGLSQQVTGDGLTNRLSWK